MSQSFDINISELLIAQLKRGDVAAQSTVFRQYEKAVYTLSLRMLGNAPAALDAMQDSFIQAITQVTHYREAAPFGMWLRSIVVNRCMRTLRDSKEHIDIDLMPERAPSTADWGNVALDQQMDLERALARLPATARAVLWLYHVEGYQHSEIAEVFGASISFSKSQTARALAQLRQLLETTYVA
jgi:RNA polymerase sigma factor (sigma-70 family)